MWSLVGANTPLLDVIIIAICMEIALYGILVIALKTTKAPIALLKFVLKAHHCLILTTSLQRAVDKERVIVKLDCANASMASLALLAMFGLGVQMIARAEGNVCP